MNPLSRKMHEARQAHAFFSFPGVTNPGKPGPYFPHLPIAKAVAPNLGQTLELALNLAGACPANPAPKPLKS